MEHQPLSSPSLARLVEAHRVLASRVQGDTCWCPTAVLNLGAAVVFHGVLEEQWLFARHGLLDRAVEEELTAEHVQLAEDLTLLESIRAADPLSTDLAPLSDALLARLRAHVARDERILYGSGHRRPRMATPGAGTTDEGSGEVGASAARRGATR